MEYTKTPISVEEQIKKLEKRGLNFSDKNSAGKYLKNIGCYRLKAYTYPFQNNTDPEADHAFIRNDIHFEDIIDLYVFDRRLRNLIFNELEKIEIAVRTKMSLVYSVSTADSWWFESVERRFFQTGFMLFQTCGTAVPITAESGTEDSPFI